MDFRHMLWCSPVAQITLTLAPPRPSKMPEEEAFCVFVRLMQEYRLRELFKPSMAELGLCIYQFEYLLQVGAARRSLLPLGGAPPLLLVCLVPWSPGVHCRCAEPLVLVD